jgi:DNA-binding MarR family transcriptional regulator
MHAVQTNAAFLASDVGRLFRKRFEALNRESPVTSSQMRMLGAISRNPGASQIMLANLLDVEAITAGRMIDRLAQAGLVERRPDPGDRRAWRLYLSERAEPLVTGARGKIDELVAQAFAGFTASEQAMAEALLERMRDNLTGVCLAQRGPVPDKLAAGAHG